MMPGFIKYHYQYHQPSQDKDLCSVSGYTFATFAKLSGFGIVFGLFAGLALIFRVSLQISKLRRQPVF